MRLNTSQAKPFAEIQFVSIAIAIASDGQNHIGILHRSESLDEVILGHLAWHNRLRTSRPKDNYLWVVPKIHALRARQVAVRCRQILKANEKGIAYAFSPPNDCFDEGTGKFLLGPNRKGLTCATFVLAVFHASGLPLAEYSTWPQTRPDDAAWRESILKKLKQDGVSEEQIADVSQEPNAVRFRPEEVAACALVDVLPCAFVDASKLSQDVLAELSAWGKPLG